MVPSMSVLDVLYQVSLDDSSAEFDVAPSMRTGCHVIASISGLRADRKHRWMITVRNRQNKVSARSKKLAVFLPRDANQSAVMP